MQSLEPITSCIGPMAHVRVDELLDSAWRTGKSQAFKLQGPLKGGDFENLKQFDAPWRYCCNISSRSLARAETDPYIFNLLLRAATCVGLPMKNVLRKLLWHAGSDYSDWALTHGHGIRMACQWVPVSGRAAGVAGPEAGNRGYGNRASERINLGDPTLSQMFNARIQLLLFSTNLCRLLPFRNI
jgi:hypothetical protein